MKKNAPFQLHDADVQESWNGHSGHLRGSTITLRHVPTGIEVKGDVPIVHRTNRQLRTAEAELRAQLLATLTDAVATHLRIRGR
jgi:hypothetical protein